MPGSCPRPVGIAVKIYWPRIHYLGGQLPCGPAAMAPGGPEFRVCGRNSGPSRLMRLLSEPDHRGEDKAVGWRPRHCPSGQVPPCGVDSWDAGRRHPRPQDNSATPKQPAFGEGPSTEGPEGIFDGGRGVWRRPQSPLPPWRANSSARMSALLEKGCRGAKSRRWCCSSERGTRERSILRPEE